MEPQDQQKESTANPLDPYRDLAEQLKHKSKELQGLYSERDALQSELERLQSVKGKVGDSLYENRGKSSEVTKLASKLETIEREH